MGAHRTAARVQHDHEIGHPDAEAHAERVAQIHATLAGGAQEPRQDE